MEKILFIRYKKSKNILEGGEQGSQKNYNVLSGLFGEDDITVYHIHDENKQKTLRDYFSGIFYFLLNYYYGLTPKRVKEIVTLAKAYDYVFIDRSVFGILAKKLKKHHYTGKTICFFHNVEVLYFGAKISRYAPWRPIVLHCVNRNDAYSCLYADKVIALNARDDGEIFKRYHRHADVLVPVAFRDRYNLPSYPMAMTSPTPLCLFLGAYFPPNNEGIEWFIKEVYPHVKIKMKIVGKGMSKIKEADFLTPEIEVVSDAPDLLPYFEEADIMIFPIFKGSGMKVKTCESLMYGKNIIATDEAFEGYEVDYDQAGGRCNSAEEFIRRIQDFQCTPGPRFNRYSREIFLQKYSEEAVTGKFKELFERMH